MTYIVHRTVSTHLFVSLPVRVSVCLYERAQTAFLRKQSTPDFHGIRATGDGHVSMFRKILS